MKIIARIKQHAVEQPNQSGSAQMLAEELSSLPSLVQKAIEDFSPGLFSAYAAQWRQAYLKFYAHDEIGAEYIAILLEISANQIDFNNNELAEYYLDEVRAWVTVLYGENSFLAKYVERYYAILDFLKGDYQSCIQRAEISLIAIHEMKQIDVPEELNDIYINREDHLENIFFLLFHARAQLDEDELEQGISILDLLTLVTSRDPDLAKSILFREAAPNLGLSPEIFQIIEPKLSLCVDSLEYEKQQQLIRVMRNMNQFQMPFEQQDVDYLEKDAKLYWVQKVIDIFTEMTRIYGEESFIGKLYRNRMANMTFLIMPGYLKLGVPQKTVAFYQRVQDMPMNAKAKLDILAWICLAYDQLNDYENVQMTLQQIINTYENTIEQVLFVFDEKKQIEFLAVFEGILQKCVYLIQKHRGSAAAYCFYINYKMLAYDYRSITKRYLNENPNYQKIERLKNENLNGRYTAEIRKIQIELFEEIGPDIYKDLFTMDLRKICDQIHNGSVLIEFTQIYREIEKKSYAAFILYPSGSIQFVELADVNWVNTQVHSLIEAIVEHRTDLNIFSTEAYHHLIDTIFAPVLEYCPPEINKLVIAPVDALFSIPFELFLKASYKVCYIDSGRELLHKKARRGDLDRKNMAAGAPDLIGFQPLSTSPYEVCTIAALLGCTPRMNERVTRDIFDETYQYLHLSTHGQYDCKVAEILSGSCLYLSGGDRISAEELSMKNFDGTELVTLAACESGLGDQTGFEGVLGLRRSFLNAGARKVIASLWKIPDAASTILMIQFYQNLLRKKLSVYEALRQAKAYLKELTAQQARTIFAEMADILEPSVVKSLTCSIEDRNDDEKLYHAPYYWASFILIESN